MNPGTYTLSLTGSNSAGAGSYGGNLAVTPLAGGATPPGSPGNLAAFVDLTTGSAPLFNSPQTGAFNDTFSFLLTNPSLVNGAFTSAFNGNQDVDFQSITMSGPGGFFAYSEFLSDPVESWALPAAGALLTPGLYTLSLVGSNSAGGGSYGGMLAATPRIASVPEPSSVALILLALSACGVVWRGRGAQIEAAARVSDCTRPSLHRIA